MGELGTASLLYTSRVIIAYSEREKEKERCE